MFWSLKIKRDGHIWHTENNTKKDKQYLHKTNILIVYTCSGKSMILKLDFGHFLI